MSRLTRFWIIFIFWFLWPAFLKNEIVYSHIENIGGEDLSDQATIIKTIEPNNIENDIDDHVINNINLDHTNHITITKKRFDYFLSDWNIFFQWNLDSSLVLMLGILSTVLVGVYTLIKFNYTNDSTDKPSSVSPRLGSSYFPCEVILENLNEKGEIASFPVHIPVKVIDIHFDSTVY